MDNFCVICGAEIPEGSQICINCATEDECEDNSLSLYEEEEREYYNNVLHPQIDALNKGYK